MDKGESTDLMLMEESHLVEVVVASQVDGRGIL